MAKAAVAAAARSGTREIGVRILMLETMSRTTSLLRRHLQAVYREHTTGSRLVVTHTGGVSQAARRQATLTVLHAGDRAVGKGSGK